MVTDMGVAQGEPFSPVGYAVMQAPHVEAGLLAGREHGPVSCTTVLDDVGFHGDPMATVHACIAFARGMEQQGGQLNRAPDKLLVLASSDAVTRDPRVPAALDLLRQQLQLPAGTAPPRCCGRYLGVYVGSDRDAVRRRTLERAHLKHTLFYERLRSTPLSAAHKLTLLRSSATGFAHYVSRCLPPAESQPTVEWYDAQNLQALSNLLEMDTHELRDSELALDQITLPLKFMGSGVTLAAPFTGVRYLSSIVQAVAEGAIQGSLARVRADRALPAYRGRGDASLHAAWRQACDCVAYGNSGGAHPAGAVLPTAVRREAALADVAAFYTHLHAEALQRGVPSPALGLERRCKLGFFSRKFEDLQRRSPPAARARLRSLTNECLTSFPWHPTMELPHKAGLCMLRLRFGLPPLGRAAQQLSRWCSCQDTRARSLEHALHCPRLNRERIRRHNAVVDSIARWWRFAGCHVSREVVGLGVAGSRQRPDLLFDALGLLVDVVVPDPLSPSHGAHSSSRGGVAARSEAAKQRVYGELARQHGLRVEGFAVEAYGQLGPGALRVLDQLAWAVHGDELSPFTRAEFLFGLKTAIQVALHAGNARLLHAARRCSWRAPRAGAPPWASGGR